MLEHWVPAAYKEIVLNTTGHNFDGLMDEMFAQPEEPTSRQDIVESGGHRLSCTECVKPG